MTVSVARDHHGLSGYQTLVPLFGMLLTVHHILYPEVASHLQVKATICASVAFRVAEVVVCDTHGDRAVETDEARSFINVHIKSIQT